MSDSPSNSSSVNCAQCPAWKKSAFAALNAEQLAYLQSHKRSIEVSRGSKLNQKGQAIEGAHCIAQGNLKISWPSQGGKESIVKIASPGDMAGYRCLFSEKVYRGTAIALEPVSACAIPKEVLYHFVESDSQFAREMLRRMGQEVAAAESRLDSFCQKNVRERLAEALLLLRQNCGLEREGKWVLSIHLTREEISSWIGTAKETVVRTLSDFKEEGLIEQDESNLVILDVSGLRKLAGVAE